jgi:hypothetical protein
MHDITKTRKPFTIVLRAMRVISLGVRRKVYQGRSQDLRRVRGFRCRQVPVMEPGLAGGAEWGPDQDPAAPCSRAAPGDSARRAADPPAAWPGGTSAECAAASLPAPPGRLCQGRAVMVAGLCVRHPVRRAVPGPRAGQGRGRSLRALAPRAGPGGAGRRDWVAGAGRDGNGARGAASSPCPRPGDPPGLAEGAGRRGFQGRRFSCGSQAWRAAAAGWALVPS